jgi:uncharacterized delta-60 repeat protein
MIQETLSFGITNNTNGVVPISIFGNTADILDNANVTTRYFWDVTSYTYENNNITLVVTSGGVTTTYTTIFTGTTLEDVVYALNQLGLAYFFLTTSGGSTFINVYTLNYTFGNLTIGNTTLLNTIFVPLNFNNTILATKVQADGNVLFAGDFTQYNATTYNRIIRLQPDGSVDATFSIGTGFNSRVYDLDVQSDGRILCVGAFTSYNGTPANRIIRLNADGSVDGTFVYGTGFTIAPVFGALNVQAQNVLVLASGKIMVVGGMNDYNGTAINGICRLNTNGSIDGTFSAGGVNVAGGEFCWSIAEQVDGKYIVGGNYTQFNAVPKNSIVRLNTGGSIDGTFGGTGFSTSSGTLDVDIQSDGKIVVCGGFGSYSGTTANNIVRINTNGTIDTSFVIGTGFDLPTRNAVIYSSGEIVIGGQFTTYQGVASNRIIKLNADGSINTAWNVLGGFATGEVISISINASETLLYMGKSFLAFDGVTRLRACSLTA